MEHFPAGDHAPQPPSTAESSNQITCFDEGEVAHLSSVLSPGQLGSSLQSCPSTGLPGHLLPGGVVEGAGLEQERWRVLLGLLVAMHEPEHADQPDQPDQPPWTEGQDSQRDADTRRRTQTDGQTEHLDRWTLDTSPSLLEDQRRQQHTRVAQSRLCVCS